MLALPRHCLDDPENHQAEPEVHQHPKIEPEGAVVGPRRQISFRQKVQGVTCQDRDQSVQEIGD